MLTSRQTFQMLENESLWQTAERVHSALSSRQIPHAILGGVAVSLHGYRRNTVDVDVLVRRGDTDSIRVAMAEIGFQWDDHTREFRSLVGTPVHFVIAGERAGADSLVRLPDPESPGTVEQLEGLPVLSLARLVESKIAAGEGNLRRAYKDFADVIELVAIHRLDGSFARHLHRSVRKQFRELARRAQASDHGA
jgi:hypothetical protein